MGATWVEQSVATVTSKIRTKRWEWYGVNVKWYGVGNGNKSTMVW